ncbi:ASKHA domain-containing protein [Eubacterium sp. 1001713B170207_170306_E7]|uniref:ASKHA domain-containing protein n=1 Tax=Eubacterium sp. 1001713B170207_170306_E7 TaxID=2787097 RepID=UPI0018998CFB|nr:ASKHA domain-containing protein [Eubacterium sp. 1001713B170207_170306_E7]
MNAFSKKIYLELPAPGPGDITADRERLLRGLEAVFSPLALSYKTYKKYAAVCREANFRITCTLVYAGTQWELMRIEAGDTTSENYGLAVDLGSTTVIMQSIDLNTGQILAEKSRFNEQIAYGDEILSRIFYTKGRPDHLDTLQASTVHTLCALLDDLSAQTGIASEAYSIMMVSGNTTMTHLFLGIDPWPIFELPFTPMFNHTGFIPAEDLGLPTGGLVYCMPSAANYLGGDIISGLLAARLDEQKKPSLFIDIGTNGEMVLGDESFLIAGAGAAGPALEGGISKSGMKAGPGAIDHVSIADGVLSFTTVGNAPPKGICGSGIVDLLSEMLLNGWIDFSGKLNPDATGRIVTTDDGCALRYADADKTADGEPLFFNQTDITQYLDTKAAANTMVAYLLEAAGIGPGDIDRVFIAGAFCAHINLEAAVNIGLYPDLPPERFTVLGNSSLTGARTLLLDYTLLETVHTFQQSIHYLEFGAASDFLTRMFAARFLPHTDLSLYPSVRLRLKEHGVLR